MAYFAKHKNILISLLKVVFDLNIGFFWESLKKVQAKRKILIKFWARMRIQAQICDKSLYSVNWLINHLKIFCF